MAEAHRLLELEGGRTGVILETLAVVAGGLAARAAYRNSDKVRKVTHFVGRKLGLKKKAEDLPKNWKKLTDNEGVPYYYNSETGKKQTHQPRKPPPDPNALEDHWEEQEDDHETVFYYNTITGESQRERPSKAPPPAKRQAPPARKTAHAEHEDHEHEEHEDHDEPPKKQRTKYSASKATPQGTPGTLLDAGKQAAGKKGKDKEPAIVYIFTFPQEKQLFSNITSAVNNLYLRRQGLDKFFTEKLIDAYYTAKFAKFAGLTIDALKAIGSKKKPEVTYAGTDKNELILLLNQAEKVADQGKIKNLLDALNETKAAFDALQKKITTARTDKSKNTKSIFGPVTKGILDLDPKLKAVRVNLAVLRNTMEQFDKVIYQSTNGLLAACQAAVLAYSGKLKTKKASLQVE